MPQELPEPILGPIAQTQGLPVNQLAAPAQSSVVDHRRPVELLSWIAPSRLFDQKPATWFLGLFAIGFVGIVVFAILREVYLILLTAAFIFVYYALARVQPTEIEHRIMSNGVESAGRLYDWKDLKSFWVHTLGDIRVLRLDTQMIFPHALELLLPNEQELPATEIEQLLIPHLAQRQKPDSETGAMTNTAILSVANIVPYRSKALDWITRKLNI